MMLVSELIKILKETQEDKNGAPTDYEIVVSHGDFFYRLVDADVWNESNEICLMTGNQCGIG